MARRAHGPNLPAPPRPLPGWDCRGYPNLPGGCRRSRSIWETLFSRLFARQRTRATFSSRALPIQRWALRENKNEHHQRPGCRRDFGLTFGVGHGYRCGDGGPAGHECALGNLRQARNNRRTRRADKGGHPHRRLNAVNAAIAETAPGSPGDRRHFGVSTCRELACPGFQGRKGRDFR